MFEEIYEKYLDLLRFYKKNTKLYGFSTLGKPLFYLKFGNPLGKRILIQSCIHAREWISIFVLDKFIKEKFLSNSKLKNKYFFVLCSNPDGFKIATCGVKELSLKRAKFLIDVNKGENFYLWKANANAVDLNVNFDAYWGKGVQNVCYPNFENYIGIYPNSELETQALIKFTKKVAPHLTISLHSKGEEVYFNFHQPIYNYIRDFFIASNVSKSISYVLKELKGSVGGYKDWCIKNLQIPALTIELGNDRLCHPVSLKNLDEIYSKFVNIFDVLENF